MLESVECGSSMLECVECGLPMLERVECGSPMLERVECGLPMSERVDCGSPMLERVEYGLPMLECVECGLPMLERVEREETIPSSNEPTSQKAKAFNLTMTNLSASTLLCESRLSIHCTVRLPIHYSVGRSFPFSSFWIRAGPKRFLAPRNAFLRHGDVNMCRLRGKVRACRVSPKGPVCVQLCLKELVRKMQGDCLICSSGSPTKRLLQITDMSRGRLAHVPAFS